MSKFTVLKFGGGVPRTVGDLPVGMDGIQRHWRFGCRVFAVESPFEHRTDGLAKEAETVFGARFCAASAFERV